MVVETRSEEYVASRIRAGILEPSTVDLLRSCGLGDRLAPRGRRAPRHLSTVAGASGTTSTSWTSSVAACGSTGRPRCTKDLVAPGTAGGQQIQYEVTETALHDLETDRPSVSFVDSDGAVQRIDADVVVGCDGSFGPSRDAIPGAGKRTWERTYPYAWLGILADVAPSTDELIYAWHPDGFALHSMRSATVSRLYLQVAHATDIGEWSDERIWDALATRLGHGQDGWQLTPGRSPTRACCRCAASSRPRCGTGGFSSPVTPRTSCRPRVPRD